MFHYDAAVLFWNAPLTRNRRTKVVSPHTYKNVSF